MARIEIGKDVAGKGVHLDLEVLLRTRALVQANSGGGKSWALRRMAEQLFGKVPVWIIDPEGEFASLRERFGFVLVGKGGETPADPRSVELVVHRFLEHSASAVFDLYDLKPLARHHYVRVLFDALMNAPKALWKPLVLKLDEAHLFAPEKGQGESEAFGAVLDVASRGRKRGICLMAYVQRLAKISKNVTAELLNRLVGMTFEGIDVESAANVLSVPKADREEFKRAIKNLLPGRFFALGPAIAKDAKFIEVGPVETTHPEPGTTAAAAPPPAPEKIRHLLPKLADLPKEAESKAKTEGELRQEVRSLRAQVAQLEKRPAIAMPAPKVQRVDVNVIDARHVSKVEALLKRFESAIVQAGKASDLLLTPFRELSEGLRLARKEGEQPKSASWPKYGATDRGPRELVDLGTLPVPPKLAPNERCELPAEAGDITPAQRRILQAVADFAGIGRHDVPRTWIAARAGASHRSSAFANNLGALRSKGLIEYSAGGIRGTVAGFNVCPIAGAPVSSEEMLASCLKLLTPAQQRILSPLANLYPKAMAKEDLAGVAAASPTSSAFANNLGALRSAGMIEYVPGEGVKAADWIFVDGRVA